MTDLIKDYFPLLVSRCAIQLDQKQVTRQQALHEVLNVLVSYIRNYENEPQARLEHLLPRDPSVGLFQPPSTGTMHSLHAILGVSNVAAISIFIIEREKVLYEDLERIGRYFWDIFIPWLQKQMMDQKILVPPNESKRKVNPLFHERQDRGIPGGEYYNRDDKRRLAIVNELYTILVRFNGFIPCYDILDCVLRPSDINNNIENTYPAALKDRQLFNQWIGYPEKRGPLNWVENIEYYLGGVINSRMLNKQEEEMVKKVPSWIRYRNHLEDRLRNQAQSADPIPEQIAVVMEILRAYDYHGDLHRYVPIDPESHSACILQAYTGMGRHLCTQTALYTALLRKWIALPDVEMSATTDILQDSYVRGLIADDADPTEERAPSLRDEILAEMKQDLEPKETTTVREDDTQPPLNKQQSVVLEMLDDLDLSDTASTVYSIPSTDGMALFLLALCR